MPGKLTYFLIILGPGIVLNLLVWGIWRRLLVPRVKAILATILMTSVYWGVIDSIAIHRLQVWAFRPDHVTGITAFNLPIEEWALFLVSGGFIVPLIFVFLRGGKAKELKEL